MGSIKTRNGAVWNIPVGTNNASANVTDDNSNQITTTDGTTFYDTLSSTTPVLGISGTNPVSYKYTASLGTYARDFFDSRYKAGDAITDFEECRALQMKKAGVVDREHSTPLAKRARVRRHPATNKVSNAALLARQAIMSELSRREFLEALAAAYAAAVIGCKRTGGPFAQEHVCIHIFDPAGSIPAPLLERTVHPSVRKAAEEYFEIGLPELLACTTRTKFLDMFQYFWPFSQSDFAQLQESIEIGYQRQIVPGTADLDDLATYLRSHKAAAIRPGESSAVVFTYNDFTRHWTPDVITACRDAHIAEFVLFKDPTLPPYLCTYPARQKGFKKPPP